MSPEWWESEPLASAGGMLTKVKPSPIEATSDRRA